MQKLVHSIYFHIFPKVLISNESRSNLSTNLAKRLKNDMYFLFKTEVSKNLVSRSSMESAYLS